MARCMSGMLFIIELQVQPWEVKTLNDIYHMERVYISQFLRIVILDILPKHSDSSYELGITP